MQSLCLLVVARWLFLMLNVGFGSFQRRRVLRAVVLLEIEWGQGVVCTRASRGRINPLKSCWAEVRGHLIHRVMRVIVRETQHVFFISPLVQYNWWLMRFLQFWWVLWGQVNSDAVWFAALAAVELHTEFLEEAWSSHTLLPVIVIMVLWWRGKLLLILQCWATNQLGDPARVHVDWSVIFDSTSDAIKTAHTFWIHAHYEIRTCVDSRGSPRAVRWYDVLFRVTYRLLGLTHEFGENVAALTTYFQLVWDSKLSQVERRSAWLGRLGLQGKWFTLTWALDLVVCVALSKGLINRYCASDLCI